jgi:hypothetical protein
MSAHFPGETRKECKRVNIMYAQMIIISVMKSAADLSHIGRPSRVDRERGIYGRQLFNAIVE